MRNNEHKTTIGGQALIEGIMMKGPIKSAMAVRKQDGEIDLEVWNTSKGGGLPWYRKVPFIRGSFNFVSTLVDGYKCLMKSAEKSGFDQVDEPSKFDKWLAEKMGKEISSIVMVLAMILGFGMAILLFMVLPALLSKLVSGFITNRIALTAIEGVLKITILILFMWSTSRMSDMKRVYSYHGAEHKTIACYEAGEELTVENVRKYSRFHPRCGTSFLLIVLVISIFVFSVVTWNNIIIRIALKFLMLPLVVGIAYEIIKLAGRYNNPITRIISAPGLCLQRMTTSEPDDDMIEVAIAAMNPVIPENKEYDKW